MRNTIRASAAQDRNPLSIKCQQSALSNRRRNGHHAAAAASGRHDHRSDILIVEHVVTADLNDGSPVVPGFADDGTYWACVARLPNARTRWRRISLAETRPADRCHGARGLVNWRQK